MNPFYAISAPTNIFNRAGEFSFPPDGWCHLVPKGEFPHPETGVVQIFDDTGLTAMVKNFHNEADKPNFPGIRGDFDHFSYDTDKPTEASCWLQDVQVRDDGLWGKLKLTNKGREAVEGGEYRLLSPTFRPAECDILNNRAIMNGAGEKESRPLKVRPLRLDSIAFCNNPNLRGMVPISNRETPPEKSEAETKTNKMKKVCEELGLSPDASEDTVLAEVKKHKARAMQAEMAHDALKNRKSKRDKTFEELEAENESLLVAQIDGDLALYANRIPKGWEARVKDMLLTNRAANLEWLKSQPEIKQPDAKPIHNRNADLSDIARRNAGTVPNPGSGPMEDKRFDTEEKLAAEKARAAAIRNRASQIRMEAMKNRNAMPWENAWKLAQAQMPVQH